jgi:transposase
MIFKATEDLFDCIRTVASCLTGFARRQFQAKIASELCHASPRRAETRFGWNRNAVERGLEEAQLGRPLETPDDRRGRPKSEVAKPEVATATDQLLNESSLADPKFQSTYSFTRMTGERLREALAEQLGIAISRLPVPRTMRNLMNRRGFSLKKVPKTIPLKKIAKTDEIFANVNQAHERARKDPSILRISIDNKAKVKVGWSNWRIRSGSRSNWFTTHLITASTIALNVAGARWNDIGMARFLARLRPH